MNYRPDMVIVKMKDNCDEEYLIKILKDGAEKAKVLADLKMKEVKQKIGLKL